MGGELDGATVPGVPEAYPSTPGEFAARWNEWDEERRARWLRQAIRANEVAERCMMHHY